MKKLILIPILLFSLSATSQEKISGLGKFKINSTTVEIISDLEKELNTKAIISNSMIKFFDLEKDESIKIVELVADSMHKYGGPIRARHCKLSKVFFVRNYSIANIVLTNVYLTFYNNLLIDIHADCSFDLSSALKIKYGTPKSGYVESESFCTLEYTKESLTLKRITGTQTWQNDDIICRYSTGTYYDYNCDKKYNTYVDVFSDGDLKKLKECDRAEEKEAGKRESQEKLKNLKDL